jgi:hypothetical protein
MNVINKSKIKQPGSLIQLNSQNYCSAIQNQVAGLFSAKNQPVKQAGFLV